MIIDFLWVSVDDAHKDEMNESLFVETRKRLVVLLALAEDNPSADVYHELELRFGHRSAHGFESILAPELWYALFEYMSSAPNAAIRNSFTSVERDESDELVRTIHFQYHHTCFKEKKKRVLDAFDAQLDETSPITVRVCASTETLVQDNACMSGTVATPFFVLRRRERCSLYVRNAETLSVACWRFDFTRIDEGRLHELEIELDLKRALRHTKSFEDNVRVDAIMAQLRTLIACLMHAMHRADAMHRETLLLVERERSARRAASEKAQREYFQSLSGAL